MRHFIAGLIALVLSAGSVTPALAQQKKPIEITGFRVGYQRLGTDYLFKSGFWTPVYVDVQAGPQGTPKADIVVETDDSDDIRSRYTMPLPPLEANEPFTLLTYTKPGSASGEITVSAVIDDRIVHQRAETVMAAHLNTQFFLSVGGGLPALRRSFAQLKVRAKNEEESSDDGDSPRRLAVINVNPNGLLPNRWFAYEPIDVVILSTGNRDFMTSLVNEREGRKEALADWVRRGGRLIVCVGKNQDVVAALEPIRSVLPITLAGVQPLPQLNGLRTFTGEIRGFESRAAQNAGKSIPVDVAKMEAKPGRRTRTILAEPSGPPLIVRGTYGLGSVTVVAFDPDQVPFTSYSQDVQVKFWTQLTNKTILPPKGEDPVNPRGVGFGGNPRDTGDLATQLQMHLEDFEAVPVISFGWVALFILVYILIVGPLDYFFLKKVVKRLELTWITFPTIVITISVIAYFTAYKLKGNDQRINKVDLLDIDLENQRIYGNTWFTLFSPRIQHYTVGLEPLGTNPAAAPGKPASSVTLSWMGRPNDAWGGYGSKSRSQGLFRRAYDYMPEASAMVGVPIQVWSTKSFESRWETVFDQTKPLVTADLRHPNGKREQLSGQITSHLPGRLQNVALLHRTGSALKWYDLGELVPGTPKRIDKLDGEGREMGPWAADSYGNVVTRNVQQPYAGGFNPMAVQATPVILKQLMFQQLVKSDATNNALRYLDESWRVGLELTDEVILFGRMVPEAQNAPGQDQPAAEDVDQGTGSLSHLWLGSLPGTGQPRQPLLGTMSLQGYVRMTIPVRPE